MVANGAFGIVLTSGGASRIVNSQVAVGADGGVGLFLIGQGLPFQPFIQGSEVTVAGGGTAVIALGTTSPTIESSVLSAPAVAFTVAGDGRAALTGNTITGTVNAATFLLLTGNTFVSGNVVDYGWLLIDPMTNSGLDPDTDILSPIDFDGNQCQDYPPTANQKVDGVCNTCGIPIPADPGPASPTRSGG